MNRRTSLFHMNPRLTTIFPLLLLAYAASASLAQDVDWAKKMFSALEHDFGTVAKNENAEHVFEIKNLYEEDIRIVGINTSCRCTDLTLDKYVLKEGETAKLVAKFNTRQFTGFKQATVTIRFAPPFSAEVQLTVKGSIRGDVLFEPSSLDFGSITSESAKNPGNARQVKITKFNNPSWRIIDVKSKFPHLGVALSQPTIFGNQVMYNMNVRIKESAPPGFTQGDLVIVASDNGQLNGSRSDVPMKFSVKVASALQISPEILTINAAPGKTVNTKVVVKASKPFKINDVTCTNSAFSVAADPDRARKVHFINVSYSSDQSPGTYEYDLEFITDLNKRTTRTVKAVVEIDDTNVLSEDSGKSSN